MKKNKKALLNLSKNLKRIVNSLRRYEPEKNILFGSLTKKEIDKYSDIDLVVIKEISGIDGGLLRNFSDKMVDKYIKTSAIIVLYSQKENKINIILRATKHVLEKNFSLEKISKTINESYNIKTGGREDFVQGGGKLDKKLSEKDLLMVIEKSLY